MLKSLLSVEFVQWYTNLDINGLERYPDRRDKFGLSCWCSFVTFFIGNFYLAPSLCSFISLAAQKSR